MNLRQLKNQLTKLTTDVGNTFKIKKSEAETLSFNTNKTIFVSSKQIKNKPVELGQVIYFTNIKQGRFNVK